MSSPLAEAKRLQQSGDVEGAIRAYRGIPSEDPEFFKALNNLGMLLEARDELPDALACYLQALRLAPDEWLLHYNLGHVLGRQERFESAAAAYRRALELCPGEADIAYNLGHMLRRLGQLEQAVQAFAQATEASPTFFQAWSLLGETLFQCTRCREALSAFRQALALRPAEASAHFDVGKTLEVLGERDAALASLRESLRLRPQSAVAREHLGRLLQSMGRQEEARAVYQEWLSLVPGDPIAEHFLATLDEPARPRPSPEYIRETFDLFSQDYDQVLARLDYAGPALLGDLLSETLPAGARATLRILDAGCGTGLCAPVLRPWAERLEGVDLSSAMLAKAQAAGQYDALHQHDLVAWLEAQASTFDLIAASDTFNYFGQLEPLLTAVHHALRPGGIVAFTLEQAADCDDDAIQREAGAAAGFQLTPTGRYVHTGPYLRRVLAQSGLLLRTLQTATLRREQGQAVTAWIVAAQHC